MRAACTKSFAPPLFENPGSVPESDSEKTGISIGNNNNNNIQFLETHNTIKNSLYACEKKSKYQTEIMIFQN